MAEAPVQHTNATNSQKNHNNPKTVLSDTTCVHGHTTFTQYTADGSVPNAAVFKQDSFNNHVRVTQCNCTLT